MLIALGILAAGGISESQSARLGPGWRRFFDLQEGRIVACYSCGALFLAGELAFLIWWARSQSLQDFKGHYRGWFFCGVSFLTLAAALQTDAFPLWTHTVLWLWPRHFPWHSAIAWMVPAALVGLALFQFMTREMRGARTGRAFLWLSAILVAGRCGLILHPANHLSPLAQRIVEHGTSMAASLAMLLALLFHARHVIHVSADPVINQPPLWRGIVTRLLASRWNKGKTKKGRRVPTSKKQARRAAKSVVKDRSKAGESGNGGDAPSQVSRVAPPAPHVDAVKANENAAAGPASKAQTRRRR